MLVVKLNEHIDRVVGQGTRTSIQCKAVVSPLLPIMANIPLNIAMDWLMML